MILNLRILLKPTKNCFCSEQFNQHKCKSFWVYVIFFIIQPWVHPTKTNEAEFLVSWFLVCIDSSSKHTVMLSLIFFALRLSMFHFFLSETVVWLKSTFGLILRRHLTAVALNLTLTFKKIWCKYQTHLHQIFQA